MKSALLSLALLLSGTLAFAQSKISPEGLLLLRQAAQESKALAFDAAVGKIYDDQNLRLIVTPDGSRTYNVFLAGAQCFTATLYNMSGVAVKNITIAGNEGTFDASDIAKGIYVLEVKTEDAHYTQKVALR